jgi:hypothetical protein
MGASIIQSDLTSVIIQVIIDLDKEMLSSEEAIQQGVNP